MERAPSVPDPSSLYVLLMFAMKSNWTVTELNAWGSENKAAIRQLSKAEQEQFTREFLSWRGLLKSDPETNK